LVQFMALLISSCLMHPYASGLHHPSIILPL
jgi:hypothetical protein